jgi:hypothetical protein
MTPRRVIDMRKIEQQMRAAALGGYNWASGNTTVTTRGNLREVFLHGHHIAYVSESGKALPNLTTLREWPTSTTKSRLRALGINVSTCKGITYVDGVNIAEARSVRSGGAA